MCKAATLRIINNVLIPHFLFRFFYSVVVIIAAVFNIKTTNYKQTPHTGKLSEHVRWNEASGAQQRHTRQRWVYLGCRLESQDRWLKERKRRISGAQNHREQLEDAAEPGMREQGDNHQGVRWLVTPGELWLTWSLRNLFGGCVLAFGLDSRRVGDPRGGAALPELFLQSFDGSIQLTGPDLEVNVHEICKQKQMIGRTLDPF